MKGFALLKADIKAWWKGIVLGVALWAAFSLLLGTPCCFVWIFGIPCPFCGMTRAAFLLLQGDFAGSFAFQPMLLPTLASIVFLLVARYVNKNLFPAALTVAILCFCVCVAFYAWKMATVYPSAAPYVHSERCLHHWLQTLLR